MNTRNLLVLILILGLLVPAAAAAPLAGPCVPGAAYNSACDANQDGSITVTDIQLTAGHWNQNGTFVSDSNHTHLGQTWTGSSNPLKLTGAYAGPDYAPLVLKNTAGDGLGITSAADNGMSVYSAGGAGVFVGSAGGDGVRVNVAGSPSTTAGGPAKNGFEVGGAEGHGLWVGRADGSGVVVNSAGYDGMQVISASNNGVYVNSAGGDGVFVGSAADYGMFVYSAGIAGVNVNSVSGDGMAVGLAGDDGVSVYSAGSPSAVNLSAANTGFEVGGAGGFGLWVGRADGAGVYVNSAGNFGMYVGSTSGQGVFVWDAGLEGVYVNSAGSDGVYVGGTGSDGVYVGAAGNDGVYANTSQADHEWGFYTPDKIYAGTALASNGPVVLVAQSGDDGSLETGDLVVVSGTGTTLGESESPPPLVRRASPGDSSVMGVVYRRFVAEEKVKEVDRDGQVERQTYLHTRSTDGPVSPGDTLLVVVLGAAQVRVDHTTSIVAGQSLTIATNGRARALGTIKVQLAGGEGTADLPEGAPVIGVAMGPAQDGLVWVMVNPQ